MTYIEMLAGRGMAIGDTRQWADDLRQYMTERTADGETWEL